MTSKKGRPPHDDLLTPAEWRVLNGTRHGLSNKAMAAQMKVSINAIKYHIRNILDKTGAANKKTLRTLPLQPKGTPMPAPDSVSTNCEGIAQIARTVRDIEEARNWYEMILELPLLYTFESMAFFNCNGTRLMLSEQSQKPQNESIIYFKVTGITSFYRGLEQKGVDGISAPHKIHQHPDGSEEWLAFFNDPEGRPLALMELLAPNQASN